MTASSDYGVSIVESFTPPKNWLPGQEVNKDVYAVNTGNIEAFVKETISGKLNYTYEDKVEEYGNDDMVYVELGKNVKDAIDGATTEEGGGFLAWTNAKVSGDLYPTGSIASARTKDSEADGLTQWTPPANGDYIFRRSIKTEGNTTSFTYAGYHYENGKYYKILIGNDSAYQAGTDDHDGKGIDVVYDIYAKSSSVVPVAGGTVEIKEDGTIEGTPKIYYVTEKEVKDADVILTYHTDEDINGDHVNDKYLKAYYVNKEASQDNLDKLKADLVAAEAAQKTAQETYNSASGTASAAEVTYQNALSAYNTALSRYNQAKADYDYAKALDTATDKLIDAANQRAAAEKIKDDAADKLRTAAGELEAKADALDDTQWLVDMVQDASVTDKYVDGYDDATGIGSYALITKNIRDRIAAYDTQFDGAFDIVVENLADFDKKYTEIKGYAKEINNNLAELKAVKNSTTNTEDSVDLYDTADQVRNDDTLAGYYNKLKTNLDKLEAALTEYHNLYANLVQDYTLAAAAANATVPTESIQTGLTSNASEAVQTFINGDFKTFKEGVTKASDDTTLDAKAKAYEEAREAYDAAKEAIDNPTTGAAKAWTDAVAAYNNEVGNVTVNGVKGAQKAYNDAIAATQPGAIDGEDKSSNTVGGSYVDTFNQGKTVALENHNDGIVPFNNPAEGGKVTGYSANFTGKDAGTSDVTPTIASDVDWKKYSENNKNVTVGGESKSTGTYNSATPAFARKADPVEATYKYSTDDAKALGVFGTPADPEAGTEATSTTTDSLAAAVDAAKTALEAPKSAYDTAKQAYDTAKENLKTKNEEVQALTSAVNAGLAAGSTIIIDIVLDDKVEDNWAFEVPAAGTKAVDFYYKHVLEAGETSAKLVDYVKLDKSVTADDYRTLTFDLNVGLNSAQVTFDDNQREYTSEAVDADSNFVKKVTAINGKDVTWGTPVVNPTYKVGTQEVSVIKLDTAATTSTSDSYDYTVEFGGKTYYGKAQTGTFTAGQVSESVLTLDTSDTITVTAE